MSSGWIPEIAESHNQEMHVGKSSAPIQWCRRKPILGRKCFFSDHVKEVIIHCASVIKMYKLNYY